VTETSLYTVDGRAALRIERALAHPPEKVWRALTEPSQLNQWFPFDVESTLEVGGTVRFSDRAGGPLTTGVITDLEPPKLLAYTWETDHLRWELSRTATGCALVLTHTVHDRYGTASFAAGWHACIDWLDAVLAGRPTERPDNMDGTHERFVAELGLDQGEVTEVPEGWRVRFERQLVRPATQAWLALVGDDEPTVGGPLPAGAEVAGFGVGTLTEAVPGKALAYEWLADGTPAGTIRWELGEGTGHGARAVLTQTGPSDRSNDQSRAVSACHDRIEDLAAHLASTPKATPAS
jgi:uncharacterized protein YndB with AHSA1/START domain